MPGSSARGGGAGRHKGSEPRRQLRATSQRSQLRSHSGVGISPGPDEECRRIRPLIEMIDQPSWRDTIRASGLSGLAALGDRRALELGIKYYAAGNPNGVRSAALTLLGATGKGDARVLPILSGVLNEGFERRSFQLISAAGEAMVALGDERGVTMLEELAKKANDSPQLASVLSGYQSRLKAKLASTKVGS